MAFEFRLPDIGEGVVEGEIIRWLVEEGQQVDEDQPLVEVMTDKATVEIPCPVKGRVVKRIGREGQVVKVGSTLVVVEEESASTKPSKEKKSPAPRQTGPERSEKEEERKPARTPVLATPAVRRLARELGVDLAQVPGSGPGGRITPEDLQRFKDKAAGIETAQLRPGVKPVETTPYRGVRRKIGEHLALSKRTAPHFTYVEEVDATELVRLRQELQESENGQNVRLTYLPFLIKAVVRGLQEYPLLNSTLDEEQGVIEIKKYYNMGIATDTPQGLMVPVVREANHKDLWRLARDVATLAEAARSGRMQPDDLKDGTFTITSLGAAGGLMATPIINHPEVAILGVHKISSRPVVREREIVIREMMNLSISLDHRVVDGALGAQFMHYIIQILESPRQLLA